MTQFLLAPTEHAIQSITNWKISTLPEKHGCDVLALTRNGIVGFQRKTLPDFVASLQDGRLYYELGQMEASATVTHNFLCVESRFDRTSDDTYYTEANISVSSFRSIVGKFAAFKVGYIPTLSPTDTVDACVSLAHYFSTDRWKTIHRPKNTRNEWGIANSETYAVFLLQSFPGVGPKVARAIYQHFNGVPLAWTVDAAELAKVPGIGRTRAEALCAALATPPGG